MSGKFQPGRSGNPGGRAKGLERLFREELIAVRHRFEATAADGSPDFEVLEGYRAAFRRIWTIAMTGEDKDSLVALKLLLERTYGLPKQKVSINEEDEEDEADLSTLSVEELRIIAKVRAASTLPPPEDDGSP